MLPITRRLDLLTGLQARRRRRNFAIIVAIMFITTIFFLQLSFTETYSTHIESEPFQVCNIIT